MKEVDFVIVIWGELIAFVSFVDDSQKYVSQNENEQDTEREEKYNSHWSVGFFQRSIIKVSNSNLKARSDSIAHCVVTIKLRAKGDIRHPNKAKKEDSKDDKKV